MKHAYILLTVLCTVYGQLIIKYQVSAAGPLPAEPQEKVFFLLRLCLDPRVLSGFVAAFLAALSWMAAMTHFELSYAYPFISLTFPVVLILSALLLGEQLTLNKVAGIVLIVAGLVALTR